MKYPVLFEKNVIVQSNINQYISLPQIKWNIKRARSTVSSSVIQIEYTETM